MNKTESFCEAMQLVAGITAAQAIQVLAVYKKVKVIKFTAHDGIKLADGRFMDRDVILRTLAQTP